MSALGFSLRLGWGTLRSRPTLTLLAVLLLALGISVLSVVASARYLLEAARAELLAGPNIDLELAGVEPRIYSEVMARVEDWPGVTSVSYLSPDQVLHEIEASAGDSLLAALGSNPFPPIVRVRFAEQKALVLDSLTAQARQWPEVVSVIYPRQVWNDLNELAEKLDRWLWLVALPLLGMTLILTALCLRAQVRNRVATWEFLSLLGLSRSALKGAFLTQQVIIGICAGFLCLLALWLALRSFQWLLFRDLALPPVFYFGAFFAPTFSSILAGLGSRPIRL